MNSPVIFDGLLLRWTGYDNVRGNVERVGPSTCGQYVCPPGYTGDCSVLERDKTPPRVNHCPGDMWVITRNGSEVVTWDEPVFSDNIGVTQVIDKSGYSPGQVSRCREWLLVNTRNGMVISGLWRNSFIYSVQSI